jgi:hypothetical protein
MEEIMTITEEQERMEQPNAELTFELETEETDLLEEFGVLMAWEYNYT